MGVKFTVFFHPQRYNNYNMAFFLILFTSLILVTGNLVEKSTNEKFETKKVEIVAKKETVETKPTVKEIKLTPVKEEVKAEPVKEEVKAEPVKEEVNVEESEKNYLKIIIYIIAGIAAIFAGSYFFSNRRRGQLASSTVDNSRKDLEETYQSETTEQEQSGEEVQSETTEQEQSDEDENNNK